MASFVHKKDILLETPCSKPLKGHIAYGGDSFVMIDAKQIGLTIEPENAKVLATIGRQITAATNEQYGFIHPENPQWSHISFCQLASSLHLNKTTGKFEMTNTVVIDPGKLDRSPTGYQLSDTWPNMTSV